MYGEIMLRTLLLAVAVTALLMTPAANAAKAPSFALWTAQWEQHSNQAIDEPIAECAKKLGGQGSDKAGACAIAVVRAAYKTYTPMWEVQVAKIARGQTPRCRKAIHTYWLASRKSQQANAIYLDAKHSRITIVDIASDLNGEPYSTLKSLTEEAKSHAIRVCG